MIKVMLDFDTKVMLVFSPPPPSSLKGLLTKKIQNTIVDSAESVDTYYIGLI